MRNKLLNKIVLGRNNTPADVPLKPRKMGFEVSPDTPRYWADGDPVKTTFANALSAIFPVGEHIFVRVMRRNLCRISDAELKQMGRKFCAQEGHHAREHGRFNQFLTEQLGYSDLSRREQNFQRFMAWLEAHCSDEHQLAGVAATEHFTSVMGHIIMSQPDRWLAERNELASMLLWHAVEEVEHKSVAFDVYENIDGAYWRRSLWLAMMCGILAYTLGSRQLYMLKQEGLLYKPATWQGMARFYFGKRGVLRAFNSRHFWSFLKPDFHPWQLDDRALIRHWEALYEQGEDMRCINSRRLVP